MLMGISVTLFVSGGTSNQVVAFLLGALVLFVGNVMGTDVIGAQVPAFVERAITTLSPLAHLNNFVKGVVDLRSVFYFLSISGVAIYLTILDVEKRA
jgi:ABC-2 type transport system permease protein